MKKNKWLRWLAPTRVVLIVVLLVSVLGLYKMSTVYPAGVLSYLGSSLVMCSIMFAIDKGTDYISDKFWWRMTQIIFLIIALCAFVFLFVFAAAMAD